jgi:hypothetical protein
MRLHFAADVRFRRAHSKSGNESISKSKIERKRGRVTFEGAHRYSLWAVDLWRITCEYLADIRDP